MSVKDSLRLYPLFLIKFDLLVISNPFLGLNVNLMFFSNSQKVHHRLCPTDFAKMAFTLTPSTAAAILFAGITVKLWNFSNKGIKNFPVFIFNPHAVGRDSLIHFTFSNLKVISVNYAIVKRFSKICKNSFLKNGILPGYQVKTKYRFMLSPCLLTKFILKASQFWIIKVLSFKF